MKKLFLLILVLFLSINANASNDKYRLTLRGNPSTSIVIGWNQVSGSNAPVYYGTTDYGTNYTSYPNSAAPSRTSSYKGMNNNFVRLTGLQPNTAYYFVIRDNEGTSRRLWFKTAPSDRSRLSFIAGGDSRNNRTPRRNANLLVSKLKPHAVLFDGDMTDDDTNSQWQNWFNDWQLTIASDGRMFPIIAARGNHEDSNNSIYNLFDTPSTSVYYAITSGNSASFIIKGRGTSLTSTSAKRVADSFEGGSSNAPRLIVSYTTEGNVGSTPPSDICDGISEWRSGVSYSVVAKVTYNGNLFERTSSGWNFLGACGTAAARNAKVAYPPIANSKIEVYPNPFTNKIKVTVGDVYLKKPLHLQLFNTNGKQVYEEYFSLHIGVEKVISPKIIATGIYILTIKHGENTIKK